MQSVAPAFTDVYRIHSLSRLDEAAPAIRAKKVVVSHDLSSCGTNRDQSIPSLTARSLFSTMAFSFLATTRRLPAADQSEFVSMMAHTTIGVFPAETCAVLNIPLFRASGEGGSNDE